MPKIWNRTGLDTETESLVYHIPKALVDAFVTEWMHSEGINPENSRVYFDGPFGYSRGDPHFSGIRVTETKPIE